MRRTGAHNGIKMGRIKWVGVKIAPVSVKNIP